MGDGSELHRLKEMGDYDVVKFNRLYNKLKPLVRKLARNVDHRRYNVSQDIIQSYFWDKFIYVFNKYSEEYSEERLRATLISSLSMFKNRLLRKAYNEQSEYYQSLNSLEALYDDSKELVDDDMDRQAHKDKLDMLYQYMKINLSPDAYLLFETQLDPPPMIKDKLKSENSKISIMMLIDFFGIARTKSNSNYITKLRREIEYHTEKARTELK